MPVALKSTRVGSLYKAKFWEEKVGRFKPNFYRFWRDMELSYAKKSITIAIV